LSVSSLLTIVQSTISMKILFIIKLTMFPKCAKKDSLQTFTEFS